MTGGKVLLTAGATALPSDVRAVVIRRVATFSEFDDGNDPRQEHDCGVLAVAGGKFFFKLDLYEDPEAGR